MSTYEDRRGFLGMLAKSFGVAIVLPTIPLSAEEAVSAKETKETKEPKDGQPVSFEIDSNKVEIIHQANGKVQITVNNNIDFFTSIFKDAIIGCPVAVEFLTDSATQRLLKSMQEKMNKKN